MTEATLTTAASASEQTPNWAIASDRSDPAQLFPGDPGYVIHRGVFRGERVLAYAYREIIDGQRPTDLVYVDPFDGRLTAQEARALAAALVAAAEELEQSASGSL